MLKNIVKNFSWMIAAQASYKLLSFLGIVYVARSIGDAQFGQFSLALYIGFFFLAFADLGLSERFIYDTAGTKINPRLFGENLGCKIIIGLVILFLTLCAGLAIPREKSLFILVSLIGIAMILDSFTLFLRSVFRSREQMQYEGISFMLEGLIKFALMVMAIKLFKENLVVLGLAILITSVSILFFTAIISKRKFLLAKPIFNRDSFIRLIKNAFPYAIVGFFMTINFKIDGIMLSQLSTDYITGWYSAAARLSESILIIPATLAIVLFPVITRIYKNSKDFIASFYKVSLTVCIACGILLFLLLFFGADIFIKIVFGSAFINSISALRILSWTMMPFAIKFFLERVMLSLGKNNLLLLIYGFSLILKIMLNLFLIHFFGYLGACSATLLTEIMIAISLFIALRRFLALRPKDSLQGEIVSEFHLAS